LNFTRTMAEKGAGEVMLTQPAVAVGVPVTQAMDRGIEWTQGIAGLYVRQKLEPLELLTGLETKNKYNIVQLPLGQPLPLKPTSSSMAPYREMANNNALLKAREQSECFERMCCPLFRGFEMTFKDGTGTNFFTIKRPFKCDPCYCPPLCVCTQQELSLHDKSGALVAKAEEKKYCCTSCCTRTFDLTGPNGEVLYTMEASECGTSTGGNNCCAPTCFNEAYEVVVLENGKPVPGASQWFVWPGCNCGGLTDLTNMMIKYPEDATPEKRAALLAGMLLIEYAVNEKKRQDNKNNNGGGGGGAPPKGESMSR